MKQLIACMCHSDSFMLGHSFNKRTRLHCHSYFIFIETETMHSKCIDARLVYVCTSEAILSQKFSDNVWKKFSLYSQRKYPSHAVLNRCRKRLQKASFFTNCQCFLGNLNSFMPGSFSGSYGKQSGEHTDAAYSSVNSYSGTSPHYFVREILPFGCPDFKVTVWEGGDVKF